MFHSCFRSILTGGSKSCRWKYGEENSEEWKKREMKKDLKSFRRTRYFAYFLFALDWAFASISTLLRGVCKKKNEETNIKISNHSRLDSF